MDIYPFDVAQYLKEGYQIAQIINCPDELFAVMACAGPSIQRRGGVPEAGPVSHRGPCSPGGLCLTLLSQSPSVRRKVPVEAHLEPASHIHHPASQRQICPSEHQALGML